MAGSYIDMAVLQQYVQGELDAAQMHEVEKAALDDVFVQDALEGLYYARNAETSYSLLQKRLHERTVESQATKKHYNKITWPRLAIGSAAAVVCILGTLLFTINRQKQGAANRTAKTERHVEVNLQDTTLPQVTVVPPTAKEPVQTGIINTLPPKVVTHPNVVTSRLTRAKAGLALPKHNSRPVTATQAADSIMGTAYATEVAEAPALAKTGNVPAYEGTVATGLAEREFSAKSMALKRSSGAEQATLKAAGPPAAQINPHIAGTLNRSLAVPNAGLTTIMLQQNRAVVSATRGTAPMVGWSSFFATLSKQVTGSYPLYVTIQTDAQGRPAATGFAPGTSDETQREFKRALGAAGLWHYSAEDAGIVKLRFNF